MRVSILCHNFHFGLNHSFNNVSSSVQRLNPTVITLPENTRRKFNLLDARCELVIAPFASFFTSRVTAEWLQTWNTYCDPLTFPSKNDLFTFYLWFFLCCLYIKFCLQLVCLLKELSLDMCVRPVQVVKAWTIAFFMWKERVNWMQMNQKHCPN